MVFCLGQPLWESWLGISVERETDDSESLVSTNFLHIGTSPSYIEFLLENSYFSKRVNLDHFALRNPTPDDSLGFTWEMTEDPTNMQHLKILPQPYMEADKRAETRAFWESLPLRINNFLHR